MEAMEVAQRYIEAWNQRDPDAIAATFSEDGTYQDPSSGGPLNPRGLVEYTGNLFAAFPDLHFDIVSAAPLGENTVAAQWAMKGTNTGPFLGVPPTGQPVNLPGADFISIRDGKIRSVQGYFDQKTLVEQLGLQAIVQPHSVGPFTFGTSVRATTGKRTRPGAFSLTWIEVRSEEEADEVRERARQVVQEMLSMPGFISSVNMTLGRRLITTTAWEDAEAPRQLLHGGAHKEAMDRVFGPDFAAAGTTMVWTPDRLNALWVRCTACGAMTDYHQAQGECRCGQALPDHPPYW